MLHTEVSLEVLKSQVLSTKDFIKRLDLQFIVDNYGTPDAEWRHQHYILKNPLPYTHLLK